MPPRPTPPAEADPLSITGIRLVLTDALRSAVAGKFRPLLRRGSRVTRLEVELEENPSRNPIGRFVAKARVELGGPDLLVGAMSHDLPQAVDQLVRLLERAIRKGVNRPAAPRFSPLTATGSGIR